MSLPQLELGDEIILRTKGFYGWMIREVTAPDHPDSAPNHSAILTRIDSNDNAYLTEATLSGVRETPLYEYLTKAEKGDCFIWIVRIKKDFLFVEPEKKTQQIAIMVEWAISQTGKPYDWQGIVGLFGRLVIRKFRLYKISDIFAQILNKKIAFFCSELNSKAVQQIGLTHLNQNENRLSSTEKALLKTYREWNDASKYITPEDIKHSNLVEIIGTI